MASDAIIRLNSNEARPPRTVAKQMISASVFGAPIATLGTWLLSTKTDLFFQAPDPILFATAAIIASLVAVAESAIRNLTSR